MEYGSTPLYINNPRAGWSRVAPTSEEDRDTRLVRSSSIDSLPDTNTIHGSKPARKVCHIPIFSQSSLLDNDERFQQMFSCQHSRVVHLKKALRKAYPVVDHA
jgi:hypothetical protein